MHNTYSSVQGQNMLDIRIIGPIGDYWHVSILFVILRQKPLNLL